MAEDTRPDPEKLLRQIEKSRRGRLTVFLGPAAGVGKTYAMLLAARERQAEGMVVVIGWVETHGRQETEALLAGLDRLPPVESERQGTRLREMDLEGLLARPPQLALVDELAHTNVPGSRHSRRFQDVEELLDAGIDVYTTVNIQHLESLNDVVAQITGVKVRETIPDSILADAAEVRLIDLSPDQLIQRLQEGKVYVPEQAQRALRSFFRVGNLNALRELALRQTAETVDAQLTDYMQEHQIAGPWPVKERVMVCVGPSPFSADLIRTGRRIAGRIKGDLLAVSVETRQGMSAENRARLAGNMRLAEQLGAETATLYGDDVAHVLSAFAMSRNVTQIVIGQPLHGPVRDLVRPSPVPRLIRLSHGISVHVIPGQAQVRRPAAPPASPTAHRPWPLRSFLEPLLAIAVVTGACFLLESHLTHPELDLLYLLPVLTSATRLGRGPALFAAVVGTLSLDFFFVDPRYTFTVADARYGFTLLVFLLVGLLISHLTARVHEEAQSAKAREARTHALYRLSRAIGATARPEEAAQVMAQEVCDLFDKPGVVLLPDERGQLQVAAEITAATDACGTVQLAPPTPPAWFDENERATAIWAFEHGESAGSGTETLSGASAIYVPMKTTHETWGLLGLLPAPDQGRLTTDELHMLEALAGLTGLALERMKLTADARRAELLSQAEAFRQALLDSVSHDLRTPLAAVIGAATSYLEDAAAYDAEGLRRLLEGIRDEAGLMNSLIEKMLDMARLESGALSPTFDWCDMQDLIGTAVAAQESLLAGREVTIDVPEGLPLVRCDFVLVERVLSNLLDNAAKYSPPGTPLEITARHTDGAVELAVLDRGPGIPPAEREAIFGKFYRLKHPGGPGGTGLGLSIAQGIIQAHGGRVWVEDRPGGGGTRAVFTLPLGEEQPGPAPETQAAESA